MECKCSLQMIQGVVREIKCPPGIRRIISLQRIDGDAFPLLDLNAVIAGNRWVALKFIWNPEPDF